MTLRRRKSPGTVGDLVAVSEPNILLLDSENAQVTKVGNWSRTEESEAVGGSYLQSNVTGDYLSFNFKGSALWIRFRFGPDCGEATVTIDSTSVTVDLYNAIDVYKYVNVAVGLDENTSHTVKISVAGTKNASSTDYYVKVDAFAYRITEAALSLHSIEYIDLINVINTINKINEVKLISNIANIDLVKELSNVGNVANISHISNIDEISLISNIEEISKINPLSALSKITTLTFDYLENEIETSEVVGDYGYYGLFMLGGATTSGIVKVNIKTMTKVERLRLGSGYDYPTSMVSDGQYLYVGFDTTPGKIAKIDLSTFTLTDTLTLDTGEDYVYALIIIGNYLYAGLRTSPGKVVRIDLSTFTKDSTLTLDTGEDYVVALESSDSDYLYAGLLTTPGKIVKIDLNLWAKESTLTLNTGEDKVRTLKRDGEYLYAGTLGNYLVKVDISTVPMSRVSSLDLEDAVYTLEVSEGYLYAGLSSEPGKIVKVDLSTFTVNKTLTLDSGEDKVRTLKASGQYLFAGLYTRPGKVVKLNIPELDVVISKIDEIYDISKIGIIEKIQTVSEVEKVKSISFIEGLSAVSEVSTVSNVENISNVQNVSSVDLVDKISEVSVVSNISNISNIENVSSVDLVDKVSVISEVSNISNIENISNVQNVSSVDLVDKVSVLSEVSIVSNVQNVQNVSTISNVNKAVMYGNTSVDGTGTSYAIYVDNSGAAKIRALQPSVDAVRLSGDLNCLATYVKYLPLTLVSAGGTVDLWVPGSGRRIRLKRIQVSVSGATAVTFQWSGATSVTDFETYVLPDKGSVTVNLLGCSEVGGQDEVLRIKSSATAYITAKASGEEE